MQGMPDNVPLFMKLVLKIADIGISVTSDVAFERFNDFSFYRHFLAGNGTSCDCSLEHLIGAPPEPLPGGTGFSTDNWQLARVRDTNILRVGPRSPEGKPDNLVVFNRDYSAGVMYQESVFELFRRFIDQFLVINLLSRRRGFLFHAAGVVWQGKGICFAGPSGAGKSTLLNLFKDEVPAECLLNDDRCALRGYGRKWRVFGTPWYGESRVSSPHAAGLCALFFIRHSKRNYVRRLSRSKLCPLLTVLGLLPLWDRSATSAVLSSFQRLIAAVPAYELGFVPGRAAVELIKRTV